MNNLIDSELDKLRNKEKSFWCYVFQKARWEVNYYRAVWFEWTKVECWWFELYDIEDYNIIWHPLTRWRIEHLFRNNKPADPDWTSCIPYRFDKCYRDIGFCLNEMWETAYDQNELQRQLHAKRPRLKGLLKQFSDYL